MNCSHRYSGPAHSSDRFSCRHSDGIFMGVCAGIADHFELDRLGVRIVAALLAWIFPVPTITAYLLIGCCGDRR